MQYLDVEVYAQDGEEDDGGAAQDHDLQQGKVIRQRPSAQSVGVDPMPSNELSGFAGKHFGLMLVVGSSSFVEQLANPLDERWIRF